MADGFDSVVILGATATGKTGLGVFLAREAGGEIVSADSRQVYRGLDIGSGKDIAEYGDTPHHLIDVADLAGEYSVFDFRRDCARAVAEVRSRGAIPFVVGGTGMYLDAIIRGYDMVEVPVNDALREELALLTLGELGERLLALKKTVHNRTDLIDRDRLVRAIEIASYRRERPDDPRDRLCSPADFRPLVVGVHFPRDELRARIRRRLDDRLAIGLVDEVRSLHEGGASWERLERLGLEYRLTSEYLGGKIESYGAYVESLYVAICQFAKRQETWFRGMERKGVLVNWVEKGDRALSLDLVRRFFSLRPRA